MNNTMTKQVDRTDREQYLEACRSYAAATSPMDGLALAQLAIAAIFAGMQIGEQNAARTQKGASHDPEHTRSPGESGDAVHHR